MGLRRNTLCCRTRWYLRDRYDVKGKYKTYPATFVNAGCLRGKHRNGGDGTFAVGGSSVPTITDQVVQNSDAQSENLNRPESRHNRIFCDEGSSGLV